MTLFKFICVTVILGQYVGAVLGVDPLVGSKAGLIRGQAAADGDYSMFLGIPYAKVDEGNPFGPLVPYSQFEGTFEAFYNSGICPQISEFDNTQIVGTLDCLHLNVYVPTAATSNNRLPVMVWIHGGGLQFGFSGREVFGPKFLVRHDVVLVTINYRLGPYGFMCVDSPAASGNQGLKDQQLALKWVKENIEAFGGDANRITIFGESAGAASVDFHVHSEEDLFEQAIMQSGSVEGPWAITNPGNDGALKLAEHLGLVTADVDEALSFLASVDSNLVIAATRDLDLMFRACVEKTFDDVKPFISEHPINFKTPKARRMPLLFGFTSDEGFVFQEQFDDPDYVANTLRESFDLDDETFDEMFEVLKHFYFGDEDVSKDTERQILDLTSDFQFLHPGQRSLRKYFDNGAQNVYSYLFSYTGERNYYKYFNNITYGGAAHADELSYLFDVDFVAGVMPDEDQLIVDRITTLWTNFAKYGNPTPETSELLPVTWVPATRDRWNYLNIDSELALETRPVHDRMAFLDLFYKLNEQYRVGYRKNEN